jgi:glyoxylase-like metal-dependent hydrolase (beta-lactamase superfamily II)
VIVAGFPAGPLQANCYVIAGRAGGRCVVIDPGQDACDELDAVLAEHRLRPAAVLLTHGHFDHCADAALVADKHQVPVYVHAADGYMLADPNSALSPEFSRLVGALPSIRPAEQVDLPASAGDGEPAGAADAGLGLLVAHTPGHTGGSVVLRLPRAGARHPEGGVPGLETDVLLAGDTLFAGSVGRTDLPGGDHATLIGSLRDSLLPLPDDTVVLPGHGPATTIGRERATNPFLQGLVPTR